MRPVLLLSLIIGGAACAAQAGPAEDVARLAWMAGTWSQEKDGVTVRETWLPPIGGAMAGAGQTNRPGKPAFIENVKITAEPAGATFTYMPPGQPPTAFVLLPGKDGEAVFENKAHDYPQRVIYRRCGADLCARTEGMVKGRLESEDWRYKRVK
jgi:hypothetical protein